MSIKKLISLMTTVCFVYASVLLQGIEAMAAPAPKTAQLKEVLDHLILPANVGRITNGKYFGSSKIVVNIQDLHCHPEVQRNISRIISELDGKYNLKNVYLEGGYGNINTSWLSDLKDRSFTREIAETLVDNGRLTGAEYYSVMNNRPDLLKGIEDEQLHRSNIVRLGAILEHKPLYEKKLKQLDKDIAFMQAKYFTSRNRKFNSIIERHAEGAMAAEKYYKLIEKYVQKINESPYDFNSVFNIHMSNYPNVEGYLELLDKGKHLPYRKISRQLQDFIGVLKQKLPYSAYNYLLSRTDNFSQLDKLYLALSRLCKEYDLDLSRNYPDLQRFFEYVDKGQEVNPVGLIKEDKQLIEEIRIGFSQDISELEVSFVVDFYAYFKDYLFNRLSADDYQYFSERFEQFKQIWAKYTYVNHLTELEPEFALLDAFYKANAERNNVFLSKMLGDFTNACSTTTCSTFTDENIDNAVKHLDTTPDIMVVVTGGFHTEGLEQLLAERKISFLSITPNVSQDTRAPSIVYAELARQQAKVCAYSFKQSSRVSQNVTKTASARIKDTIESYTNTDFRHSDALGLVIQSCLNGMARFGPVADALIRKIGIGDPDRTAAMLRDMMAEMKVQGTVERLDGNRIKLTIGENSVVFGNKGIEGIAEQDVRPGIVRKLAGVLPFLRSPSERAADACLKLVEMLFASASIVGFGTFLNDLTESFALWLAEENYISGAGAIYPIVRNPALGKLIEQVKKISPDQFAKFPAWLQKTILDQTELEDALHDKANRDIFFAALLTIAPVRAVIESMNFGKARNSDVSMASSIATEQDNVSGALSQSYAKNKDLTPRARNINPDDGTDLIQGREVAEESLFYSDATRKTYDRLAEQGTYNKLRGLVPEGKDLAKLLQFIELVRGASNDENQRVLDEGTGIRDLKWLSEQSGIFATGIDFSEGVVKSIQSIDPSLDIRNMDMCNVTFDDETFDGVRAWASLHHIPLDNDSHGADASVKEACRVLKPGGIYCVLVKGETPERHGFMGVETQEKDGTRLGIRYYQFYSKESLQQLLERHGFELIGEVEEHTSSRGEKEVIAFARKPYQLEGNGDGSNNKEIANITADTRAQYEALKRLMQDREFVEEIARALDKAYYDGLGQVAPDFVTKDEQSRIIKKSYNEDKVARNLLGFIALECGLGVICERENAKPSDVLDQIINNTLSPENRILLARFAHATWKMSQPFRGLKRIALDDFIPAPLLSDTEVQIDHDQIIAAAGKLAEKLSTSKNADAGSQFAVIKGVMQNEGFAYEMAEHLNKAYHKSRGDRRDTYKQGVFLSPEKEDTTFEKKLVDEKIAINSAGFYGLESGLSYLAERDNRLLMDILKDINDGELAKKDVLLLARFVNATWKASQPFRDLNRITKGNFIPASMLSKEEMDKDYAQILAAGKKLYGELSKNLADDQNSSKGEPLFEPVEHDVLKQPFSILDPLLKAITGKLLRNGSYESARRFDAFRKTYNLTGAVLLETYLFLQLPSLGGIGNLFGMGFFAFIAAHFVVKFLTAAMVNRVAPARAFRAAYDTSGVGAVVFLSGVLVRGIISMARGNSFKEMLRQSGELISRNTRFNFRMPAGSLLFMIPYLLSMHPLVSFTSSSLMHFIFNASAVLNFKRLAAVYQINAAVQRIARNRSRFNDLAYEQYKDGAAKLGVKESLAFNVATEVVATAVDALKVNANIRFSTWLEAVRFALWLQSTGRSSSVNAGVSVRAWLARARHNTDASLQRDLSEYLSRLSAAEKEEFADNYRFDKFDWARVFKLLPEDAYRIEEICGEAWQMVDEAIAFNYSSRFSTEDRIGAMILILSLPVAADTDRWKLKREKRKALQQYFSTRHVKETVCEDDLKGALVRHLREILVDSRNRKDEIMELLKNPEGYQWSMLTRTNADVVRNLFLDAWEKVHIEISKTTIKKMKPVVFLTWVTRLLGDPAFDLGAAVKEYARENADIQQDNLIDKKLRKNINYFADYLEEEVGKLDIAAREKLRFNAVDTANNLRKDVFVYDDVKWAYRFLAKVYHSDVGGSEDRFKVINEVFEYVDKNKKIFSTVDAVNPESDRTEAASESSSNELSLPSSYRAGEWILNGVDKIRSWVGTKPLSMNVTERKQFIERWIVPYVFFWDLPIHFGVSIGNLVCGRNVKKNVLRIAAAIVIMTATVTGGIFVGGQDLSAPGYFVGGMGGYLVFYGGLHSLYNRLFGTNTPADAPLTFERIDVQTEQLSQKEIDYYMRTSRDIQSIYPKLREILCVDGGITEDDLKRDVVSLCKNAKPDALHMFRFGGLPVVIKLFGEELKDYWPGLMRLARVAKEDADPIFEFSLPSIKELFGGNFRDYWPELVEMGIAAKSNVRCYFEYRFRVVHGLIENKKDFVRRGQDLLNILNLTGGVESETLKSIGSLQEVIDTYPGSFDMFVKPVVFRQTVGAYLCFQSVYRIWKNGGIQSADDLAYLRAIIERFGLQAHDVLANFIEKGMAAGIIGKPLSVEKKSLNTFFDAVPYSLIEMYAVYKEDHMQLEDMQARCEKIHREIVEGTVRAETEKDSLFSAMLMYVFPPAVTRDRGQYLSLYRKMADRQDDTAVVGEALQGKRYVVKTGAYVLKDPAQPLDKTAWAMMAEVIQKVNKEEIQVYSEAQRREAGILLGRQLMGDWESGRIDETENQRAEFLEKIYWYYRLSQGEELPDGLRTVEDVMAVKDYFGDGMRDVVDECLRLYAGQDQMHYEAICHRMMKTGLEHPVAMGKQIDAALNPKTKGHDEMSLTKKKEIVRKIVKIQEKALFERLWVQIKDCKTAKEIGGVLSASIVAVGVQNEGGLITRRLQGTDYHAMQGEVNAKYAYSQASEKMGLRCIVSKRKAHCAAGFNMGACVASDEKLWNNPHFMSVVMFNDMNIAVGGMYLLVMEDDGKRYLFLAGIDPSVALLTHVSPDDIYSQFVDYAFLLANDLGCSDVLIPTEPVIHSDRTEIQRLIESQGYQKKRLSKIHEFSYSPHEHSFNECYVVSSNKGVALTREATYQSGERLFGTYENTVANAVREINQVLNISLMDIMPEENAAITTYLSGIYDANFYCRILQILSYEQYLGKDVMKRLFLDDPIGSLKLVKHVYNECSEGSAEERISDTGAVLGWDTWRMLATSDKLKFERSFWLFDKAYQYKNIFEYPIEAHIPPFMSIRDLKVLLTGTSEEKLSTLSRLTPEAQKYVRTGISQRITNDSYEDGALFSRYIVSIIITIAQDKRMFSKIDPQIVYRIMEPINQAQLTKSNLFGHVINNWYHATTEFVQNSKPLILSVSLAHEFGHNMLLFLWSKGIENSFLDKDNFMSVQELFADLTFLSYVTSQHVPNHDIKSVIEELIAFDASEGPEVDGVRIGMRKKWLQFYNALEQENNDLVSKGKEQRVIDWVSIWMKCFDFLASIEKDPTREKVKFSDVEAMVYKEVEGQINFSSADSINKIHAGVNDDNRAIDLADKHAVTHNEPAILDRNTGRYYQRLLQGWPQWLALAEVHVRELLPMVFNPSGFDKEHGTPNAARSKAIRAMHASFWLSMIPGLAIASGALAGLAVPTALVFWGISASTVVGIVISGVIHVRYDMKAGTPVGLFVTENADELTGDPKMDPKRGYTPIVVTPISRCKGDPENTGIKGVCASLSNGKLTIYVAGEGETFVRNAADVIKTLKGYGNVSGNSRILRVLRGVSKQDITTFRPVVFNYTKSAVLANALIDIPVLPGTTIPVGYGAIINAHNAEKKAREVAIERPWSPQFNALKDGERLNNSLVMTPQDLQNAGVEAITRLRSRGAKIYVLYDDDSEAMLRDMISTYGIDGAIARAVSADAADRLTSANESPDFWVAGNGRKSRAFMSIDIVAEQGKLPGIKPFTVVKVALGENFKRLDDAAKRAHILGLNQLPASCIIVFNGTDFISDTRVSSRDITAVELFGVNILDLLHIVPLSREEKEEYERTVAYQLDMGAVTVYDDGTSSFSTDFEEAVQLHAHGISDENLKALFMGTIAARKQARVALARDGNVNGLADVSVERLLSEMMAQPQVTPAAQELSAFEKAEIARIEKLRKDLATLANTADKADQVYLEFFKAIPGLKSQAKSSSRTVSSQAMSAIIELIRLYGEPKFKANVKKSAGDKINVLSVQDILQAA